MIFSSHRKLADLLVLQLAAQPNQRVQELQVSVARAGRSFSPAAVYKELAALKTHGVVVKQRDRFSLSFSWIAEVQQFVEKAQQRYRAPDYLASFLPQAVGRQVWHFSSLMAADDYWNQLLLALVAESSEPRVFSWVPHPWFVLIHTAKERKLHAALSVQKKHFYTIFGGDSYLDRLAERFYHRPLHTCAFAAGPFEALRDQYIDVLGEYVLTVKLDSSLVRTIGMLFRTTHARRDVDPLRVTQLLAARSRMTVTLERNNLRARKLRRQFCEYFGLPS